MKWWLRVVSREQFQSFPIARNQRRLLDTRPAFDLLFECKRLFSRQCRLNENQFDRTSLGNPSVRLRLAMGCESHVRFVRVTRVVGAVSTLQDVDVESHGFPSIRGHGSTSSPRTEREVILSNHKQLMITPLQKSQPRPSRHQYTSSRKRVSHRGVCLR